MASGVPEHAATGPYSGKRSAARWNAHLRFALTTGLRFSAHSNENTTTEKGTFLNSFDISNLTDCPPDQVDVCSHGYLGKGLICRVCP